MNKQIPIIKINIDLLTASGNKMDSDRSLNQKPCVDIQLSLKLSNGNSKLAAELLNMLINELPKNKHDINNALQEKCDFDNALEIVHQLHGGSCCCGTPFLKQACHDLESQLKIQKDSTPEQELQKVNKAIDDILEWHQNNDIDSLFLTP